MSYQIQQSSSAYPLVFFMTDSTDHITGKTGLSPNVVLRKAGGSFAVPAGSVTQIDHGWYQVAGNATDSNTLGPLLLHATATGADTTDVLYVVVGFNPNVNFSTNAAAGASGGLLISGTNSGTTTLGALTITGATTHTGNVALAAGLTIAQSTTNGHGLTVTGNGTGSGIRAVAGAMGKGLDVVGGSTSGVGIGVSTTSGDGISVTPTAGNALTLTANGTSKHGAVLTGGTAGTSDGLKAVAGTGGVDIRGSITGNVSGSVGSIASAGITAASFDTTAGAFSALGIIDQGTAQGTPTSTTIQLRSAATFADNELIGATILITGGSAGVGQARVITAYTGSSDTATVDAWSTTPTGTVTYKIFGSPPSSTTNPIPANAVAIEGKTLSNKAGDNFDVFFQNGGATTTNIVDNAGGGSGTDAMLLVSTTLATLASQTSFTLTAGSADNRAYNGATAIITDQTTSTQKAVGLVNDYTGSTRTVTLAADPGIFTMAAGDSIKIYAAPKRP